MDRNDILTKQLINKINKIEKMEAKLQKEKAVALQEIKKEISKQTFDELLDKVEKDGYPDEQLVVEDIREKEAERQKIEYDDYVTIVKMYTTISSSKYNLKD